MWRRSRDQPKLGRVWPYMVFIVGGRHHAGLWGAGLMVSAGRLSRLDVKLDALAASIDTDSQSIAVVLFVGETREFALQRHRDLRPDHAGRPVRFEHRNVPRTEVVEMFAVSQGAERAVQSGSQHLVQW